MSKSSMMFMKGYKSAAQVRDTREKLARKRTGSFYCGTCDAETVHSIELVSTVSVPEDPEAATQAEVAARVRDHGHRVCQACGAVRCARPQDCPGAEAVRAANELARERARLAPVVRMDAPTRPVGRVRRPPGAR